MPKDLKFVGDGTRYVPGVAATDLGGVENEQAAALVATGLYEYADKPAVKPAKPQASAQPEAAQESDNDGHAT